MVTLPRSGVVALLGLTPLLIVGCGSGGSSGTGNSAGTTNPSSAVTSTTTTSNPTAPVPPVPAVTNSPDAAFLASLVGLTLAEATKKVEAAGFTIRIASVDGKPRALTMDYSPQRINVNLAHDKVTKATVG